MNITSTATPEASLVALGYSETEAALYCALLASGPATAYRLAKRIGKAPPNAYQALATLTQKGAVQSDEDDPRTFRATPADELLAAMGGAIEARLAAAERQLSALATPAPDDRIYQVEGAAAVIERARAIFAGARQIVLFDLFPSCFATLRPAIQAAVARGVIVAGLVYDDADRIDGVDTRISPTAPFALDRWPGAQLTVIGDAREHLVALMSRDLATVRRAVWSDSVYLSCLQHSGLSAEIRLCPTASGNGAAPGLSLLDVHPDGLRSLIGEPTPTPSTSKPQDLT